jgi:S1-C subfamily serine protease
VKQARRLGFHTGGVKSTRLVAAGVVVAMVGISACGKSDSVTSGAISPLAATAAVQANFVAVVNKVRPSVVEISTGTGLGSGVVFDSQGDIVTNAHVVATASNFQVTFFDGQIVPGTLVGIFAPDDLAVIRVSRSKGVTAAAFADSSKLQVGDIDMAIGNPLGLASSVTQGIVSFTGRTVSEGNGVVLPDTIQTSAPINPGNSGGALVNDLGQVIGIPTLAATDPQLGGGAASGIGFAIPSNTAKMIAPQLIAQGHVVNSGRAALGISGATAVDAAGNPGGVIVASVTPGGPAAKAGIAPDDIITMINGQPTPTLAALQEILAGLHPGDKATLTIVAPDGTTHKVSVTFSQLSG